MSSDYQIEIEAEISLSGPPSALATLAFSSPRPYIAAACSDQSHISLIESGSTQIFRDIPVGSEPCAITRGSNGLAYVACQGSNTLDVINGETCLKQVKLPGRPYGAAWNGNFKRGKQRIMVTCEDGSDGKGLLCVLDEETLEITGTLPIGHRPRGICLDQHRKLLFVANFGDDSVTIVDQTGLQNLHTLATAGRPLITQYSWADPDHLMISLDAGGVLQRMDASILPPQLSGLIALKRKKPRRASLVPSCCLPIGQDGLWIAADQSSHSIALIRSEDKAFSQIDCFEFELDGTDRDGFGQIAIATLGLPARFYVADPSNERVVVAQLRKTKSVTD